MTLMEALRQDIHYALRGLRLRPAFAGAVAVTIALGMGANATMFGIIDRLLFRGPDQIRDPESVVQIETHETGSPYTNSSFSYAAYTDYRNQPGSFSAVGITSSPRDFPLGHGADARRVTGSIVSASFFGLLGARPALGRYFSVDEDDPDHPQSVVVIGFGFWQRRFGASRDAIGQQLELGTQRYRIIGVAPQGFTGIDLTDVDVWIPISAADGLRFDSSPTWTTNRGSNWLRIIGRIEPGASLSLAAERATAVHRAGQQKRIDDNPKLARFIKPDSERAVLVSLVPGRVPKGASGVVDAEDVQVSTLLALVAIIVLIIACANVANLLLVRAFGRRREIAVRLALGVGRGRLVMQILIETLLLAALGGIGAVLLAYWSSQGVRTLLLGERAWATSAIDGRLLGFTAAMTLATGIVTAVVPALVSSRTDIGIALKAGAREGGGKTSPIRTALLVMQAALAIVLLAGSGLFIRSVHNVNHLPFGIDIDRVLVADIKHKAAGLSNAEARRLFDQFALETRRLPGVASTAVAIGLPFNLNWGVDVNIPGRVRKEGASDDASQYAVTPDYFKTLGIPLQAGRVFTTADRTGSPLVTIVNAKMAQLYWPGRNPVGECVKLGADTMPCTTVIGVVGNTVRQGIEDIVPQLYRPLDQMRPSDTDNTISFFGYELVVRTNRAAARLTEPVRRTMQSVGPNVPYANVYPMADLLGRRVRQWELGAKVFTVLGLLALVLAAVGLYSVMAFTIAQRRHEFGVRTALGAQAADLVRLTLTKALSPVVAGIAAGVALSVIAGPFVEPLLFHVSARDPEVFVGVALILLVTALIASLAPARRAARVDPATVLRTE